MLTSFFSFWRWPNKNITSFYKYLLGFWNIMLTTLLWQVFAKTLILCCLMSLALSININIYIYLYIVAWFWFTISKIFILVFIFSKQRAMEFYFLRPGKILPVHGSQGYSPLLFAPVNYIVLPIIKYFTEATQSKNPWHNITNCQSFSTEKTPSKIQHMPGFNPCGSCLLHSHKAWWGE